jgi:cysteine desulfurase family protein (TIGR01976 family)
MNENLRQQFPALKRLHLGAPLIFMDGPAGTQVPQSVIDAISTYYQRSNANTHGAFITSQETDEMMDRARANLSIFLGAEGPHTISLGQNMTSLNYALARALARVLQPGDEILITQLDHEANRGPWLSLRENGILIREVTLQMNGHLDYKDLEEKLSDRTRLVAMGYASNILGTVNDVKLVRRLTYQAGAWLLLDAVHFAPHFGIDVQDIDCDFLLCSAYKFYGPHVGALYSRPGLLDRLRPDRLRTAGQQAPYSIETGTLNHAAMAGVDAAIRFIATLGQGDTLRRRLLSAMKHIHQHEIVMAQKLYTGLEKIERVRIIGPHIEEGMRAPTLAVAVEGWRPSELCQALAQRNILAWDGHFYALRATEVLGLHSKGGVTRLGISVYTTEEDVKKVLSAFNDILAQ